MGESGGKGKRGKTIPEKKMDEFLRGCSVKRG